MPALIAYLHGRQTWSVDQLPGDQLTTLNYAFAKLDGLDLAPTVPNIDRIAAIQHRFPKLKINLSIGGWGADGFSDAVATKVSRQTLATNILNFIQKYHFDGVDLDWEYPGVALSGIKATPDDAQNFTAFLAQLSAVLTASGHDYPISAAVGADSELLAAMAVAGEYRYADYLTTINVMSYDLRGSWTEYTGHQANLFSYSSIDGALSADQAVQDLLQHGVPAEKIVVGAAAYSRDWVGFDDPSLPNALHRQAQSVGSQTTPYVDLKTLIADQPEHYFWDETAQAPYYFDGQTFRSFDDPRSLRAKADYVKHQNLGGLMLWELSLDPAADLIRAAHDQLDQS